MCDIYHINEFFPCFYDAVRDLFLIYFRAKMTTAHWQSASVIGSICLALLAAVGFGELFIVDERECYYSDVL